MYLHFRLRNNIMSNQSYIYASNDKVVLINCEYNSYLTAIKPFDSVKLKCNMYPFLLLNISILTPTQINHTITF